MATAAGSRRFAILIDGDNIPPDLVGDMFAAAEQCGRATIRRVYGTSTGIAGWREAAAKFDIALREVPPGKNATDMKLAIDAMDILYRGKIDGFCIVSSDSDFAELARRLREDGVTVEGYGEGKAPIGFRQACDSFVVLRRKTVVAETPKSPDKTTSQVNPVAKLMPVTVNPEQRDTKPANRVVNAAWAKLLAQALMKLPLDNESVKISLVSQQLQLLDQNFSAKKYGGTSFRALLTVSGLELRKVGGHWCLVIPPEVRRAA